MFSLRGEWFGINLTPQQEGLKWEDDFANEFGLDKVPGSGSAWWSGKLDVSGQGARWSLKFTNKESYSLTKKDISEALEATGGLAGTSEVPLWAIKIQDEELIIIRKEDFKRMQQGELNVLPERRTKTALRTQLASVPILLRENDYEDEGD